MKSVLLICMLFTWIYKLAAQDYRIHFFQDAKEVPILNEKVQLSKSTFQIQVELIKVDGVYGSCSLSDSLFQIPLNQFLPESDLIQWKIAVEPENNVDKDIIVSKESYFYWFYNPKVDTWHRFDPSPIVEKGRVIGTKTISSFFVSDDNNTQTKSIAIAEIQQPMYMLFFLMNEKDKESKRIRVQLLWK